MTTKQAMRADRWASSELTQQDLMMLERRRELSAQKLEIQKELGALNLSPAKLKKHRDFGNIIPEGIMKKRESLLRNLNIIEEQLKESGESIKKMGANHGLHLLSVIEEILPKESVELIKKEAKSRSYGAEPKPVRIPMADVSKKDAEIASLRRALSESTDTLKAAREALNEYIRTNCPELNKAVFMQPLSAVNRALPPVEEITKKKRLLNIK